MSDPSLLTWKKGCSSPFFSSQKKCSLHSSVFLQLHTLPHPPVPLGPSHEIPIFANY